MLTAVMVAPDPCDLGPVPRLPWRRSNLSPTTMSLKILQPVPARDATDTFQSYIRESVASNDDVGYQFPAPIWPGVSWLYFDEFHWLR